MSDHLKTFLRTHTCGSLRAGDIGKRVRVCGWVFRIRDKGNVVFVDLRDRWGVTQLVAEASSSIEVWKKAKELGREMVIEVYGEVRKRSNVNKELSTGEIEVVILTLQIWSKSEVPPFTLEAETDGGSDLRMRYRYLDIRRSPICENLLFKHELCLEIRRYLSDRGFIEVETPLLVRSTPEGARDFVVPSRLHAKAYYALPQSPQLFKQLLMIGGMDRYFQLARCFRDEDYRADRQPEFTQLDCELSFVDKDGVMAVFEGLIRHLFSKMLGVNIKDFPRMSYEESMRIYGTDKPDLYVTFHDASKYFGNATGGLFQGKEVWALRIPKGAILTRKDLDRMKAEAQQKGMHPFAYVQYRSEGDIRSSLGKWYSEEVFKRCYVDFALGEGDMLLLAGGSVSDLRDTWKFLDSWCRDFLKEGRSDFSPLWVTDFPLFEPDSQGKYHSVHHPFTNPVMEEGKGDLDLSFLRDAHSQAYDLVINGVEIGGGSMRIMDAGLQEAVFEVLGMSKSVAHERFGFLLEALRYGVPPHGGIAIGIDRLCALMHGGTIRDYIAFPKNAMGRDMMQGAPSLLSSSGD